MAAWKLARGPQSSCGFNIFFPSSSFARSSGGERRAQFWRVFVWISVGFISDQKGILSEQNEY